MLFLNINTGLGYFIRTTHINWSYKVWVDLINERQQETHSLLGKKMRISWNKPIRGGGGRVVGNKCIPQFLNYHWVSLKKNLDQFIDILCALGKR